MIKKNKSYEKEFAYMPNEYYISQPTQKLIEAIRFFHQAFPVSSAISSVEILIQLILLTAKEERITLKKIYRSVPFAENTVRSYLRLLSDAGWIHFFNDDKDSRLVCLEITPKFYKNLILLSEQSTT